MYFHSQRVLCLGAGGLWPHFLSFMFRQVFRSGGQISPAHPCPEAQCSLLLPSEKSLGFAAEVSGRPPGRPGSHGHQLPCVPMGTQCTWQQVFPSWGVEGPEGPVFPFSVSLISCPRSLGETLQTGARVGICFPT